MNTKNNVKRCFSALGAILAAFILLNVSSIIGYPVSKLFSSTGSDAITFAGQYFSFIGIWVVMLLFLFVRKKNRPMLKKLCPGSGNNLKTSLAVGLSCGIGLNLLVGIIAMLHGDIYLSFNEFNPGLVLLFVVSVMIQSGAEELMNRLYLYQKLAEIFPESPLPAILVNAIFFAALHLPNPGVTVLAIVNILLSGLMFSLIVYYFDSFWGAVIAHTSWNFCQSILLGLPNSGIVSAYSIFKLDASTAVDSFAYNVNFGIESSLLATIFMLIACAVIIVIGRKRKAACAA